MHANGRINKWKWLRGLTSEAEKSCRSYNRLSTSTVIVVEKVLQVSSRGTMFCSFTSASPSVYEYKCSATFYILWLLMP